ncbi:MAG: prealbumin-like fold domain-containing protein [Candidatus Hydrogenedentales bacterium]
MKHAANLVLCVAILASCSPAPAPAPAAPPAATAPAAANKTTLARVRVVNMDGQPLPNMMPIAAKQPNAFEKPIAQGALTDMDGKGVVVIPQDEWLYVRAWDPTRRVFANNFFDVLPGNATQTDEMVITMVPGASLAMELVTPEGGPAAEQNVGIMMFHPTRGPWWPDEADSDKDGHVTFASLPPGKYTIKLKTAGGYRIDIPDVVLPPSGSTDLGVVALQ